MSTPANPITSMMGTAQQSLQNPMAQAVPQPSGGIDPTQHPVVGAIIKLLANAAQSYGWTSMYPQERLERQQMEQQKAETMARLAMQQQQLGYEGQRVGFEGQRTAADVKRSQAEANRATVEAGEAPKRTAIQQQGVDVERQRANQSYEVEKRRLQMEADKYAAEYGTGGLRSQEVAATTSRAATDARLADIADRRERLEAQYKQAEAQRAGLSTDRATLEDERKSRVQAVTEIYGKSPWYEPRSTTLSKAQSKIKEINDDINARIAQAEKVAGTGAGIAKSATGNQGGDVVTVISNGVRGTMPRANLGEAQKRDPKLQVVQ